MLTTTPRLLAVKQAIAILSKLLTPEIIIDAAVLKKQTTQNLSSACLAKKAPEFIKLNASTLRTF